MNKNEVNAALVLLGFEEIPTVTIQSKWELDSKDTVVYGYPNEGDYSIYTAHKSVIKVTSKDLIQTLIEELK